MSDVASTQEELENNALGASLFARAKELMEDAALCGFILNINMHTIRQKAKYQSNDVVMVAPDGIKAKTLMSPDASVRSEKYTG